MKIVILDSYGANPGDLSWDGLNEVGPVTIYDRTKPEETVDRAADAEILLTNKVILGRKEIEQLPKLRYIGVLATGYNVVDIKAAHERDIVVTNVPAYSTESVAQMVFSHLLTVVNHTEHYALQNRDGRWSSNPDFCYWDTPLTEIAGKTFGIVGLGNIAADALPAGIEKTDFPTLLSTADILSLHCPLTDDTRHLINAEALRQMKPTAILINTGRGPLINETDVAEALSSGQIAAYCADVLSEEPPKADHPLLGLHNAYITPHIAWATHEARIRLLNVAISNVIAFAEGHPQNKVL